jgi:hypothetical protein
MSGIAKVLAVGLSNSIPQLKRGMVWCRTCGRNDRVNSARAMLNGWPKCCGYTMTIDSPEERAALSGKDDE